MRERTPALTAERVAAYARHLREREYARGTIEKYTHALAALGEWLGGRDLTKQALLEWKQSLAAARAAASVNAAVAAVNGYLTHWGWTGLRLRPLRVQRPLFSREERELTRGEYVRLVETARRRGRERLALMLQSICATGIRVSELRFLMVESLARGRLDIYNKGKGRTVLLPRKLCRLLRAYARDRRIAAGAVFLSRRGRPLDRSSIWREMKALCAPAGVPPAKVFPHNLRHLFARTYYALEKNLGRLADLLGHSNVNTTRIYTAESGTAYARRLERLGLIVT